MYHLNCWPRHEAEIQHVLGIPNNNVRRLERLRKRDIYEIIKRAGIHNSDWQHLLISQSDGKPGLAAALAERCKHEGFADIWSGEVTAQEVLASLRLAGGERERCVLAAFAVGGDGGITFEQVSRVTGFSTVELREITASLGSGGVIEEVEGIKYRLQVRPPAIRPILVREVFFGGAGSLPLDPLLEAPYWPASTATVLLAAKQRGANVDYTLLEDLVLKSHSKETWEHFAWVDKHCADRILDKYPEQACLAATGLLHFAPRQALNALLTADEKEIVKSPGAIAHPLLNSLCVAALAEDLQEFRRAFKIRLPHQSRNPAILVHQRVVANIDGERGNKPLHVGGVTAELLNDRLQVGEFDLGSGPLGDIRVCGIVDKGAFKLSYLQPHVFQFRKH